MDQAVYLDAEEAFIAVLRMAVRAENAAGSAGRQGEARIRDTWKVEDAGPVCARPFAWKFAEEACAGCVEKAAAVALKDCKLIPPAEFCNTPRLRLIPEPRTLTIPTLLLAGITGALDATDMLALFSFAPDAFTMPIEAVSCN